MFRDLKALAEGVYLYPRDDTPDVIQPNIGIIKLPEQTLLIDCGNSPRHVRRIMAAMAGGGFAPVDTLIYTHHHWDHTFGAAAWNANTIIAHESNLSYMQSYRSRSWSNQSLREAIHRNPKLEPSHNAMMDAFPDWRDFRVILPNIVFSQRLALHYDSMSIELEHVGGRHSSDAIIVKLPQEKIIFLGDSFYPPPFSERQEGDNRLDLPLLERLVEEHYEVYVDGHHTPRSWEQLADLLKSEEQRQGF